MRRIMRTVVITALVLLTMSMTSLAASKTVTVLGTWGGQELEAFNKMVEPFEKQTGIQVQFTGTRDLPTVLTTRVAAGNPPDVAALPNPGMMQELAAEGRLIDLAKVLDMNAYRKDYSQAWIDLGSYQKKLHAIFISADLKSLVWYNPKSFAAKGYAIPKTWEELIRLSDKIVSDGGKPWAVGLESGAASGWPGTDWIEDIMLRTAGPDLYDQWVKHQIPWTHPAVKRAFEVFGQIARKEAYVHGGVKGVLATNFGQSVNALFGAKPGAYMHRQATFIKSFILQGNPGLVAGTDYNAFVFPSIDTKQGVPLLGAGDMVAMFKDTPEARQFMNYLAGAAAQKIWVQQLGKLSVNRSLGADVYPDQLTRQSAQLLANATVFRFDGSDLMPGSVGSGAFWEGVLKYVSGENLDSVLRGIEAVAKDSY